MAYFPDLSAYKYASTEGSVPTRNIGWLERGASFPVAEPTNELLDRLWRYCSLSVLPTRGLHPCPFCERVGIVAEREGSKVLLGSAEIRIFDGAGTVAYAAPNLVYHYVAVHHYLPPAEFLEAIESGPLPPAPGYQEMLKRAQVTWIVTPPCDEEPIAFRPGHPPRR